jgi:hypothetical protein
VRVRLRMMINFWLAARFGGIWLRVHKGLRPALGQMPGECMRVARGEPIAAGRVLEAEDFAVLAWWRAAMAVCVLLLLAPVAAVTIAGPVGRDIASSAAYAGGGLAVLAASQMGYLRIKYYRLRLYLTKAGPSAKELPVERAAPGRPRPADFWVILVVPAALYGFFLFAGLEAAAGH